MTASTLDRPRDQVGRKPLILLVEDKEDSRDSRRRLFESFDCTAVAVGSSAAAIRELDHAPLPDLVVTDIHMPEDPGDTEDRSGIELARLIKQRHSDLPVAGYSGYFEETDINADEIDLFDIFDVMMTKGRQSPQALEAQLEECVALARAARDRRIARSEEQLTSLRRRHEIESSPIEVRRRLALDPDSSSNVMVEGPLGQAGYRLRLVSAATIHGAEPFVVWVNGDESGVHVEVYGRSELYAIGRDESDALSNLAELMHLLAAEANDSKVRLPPAVRSLYGWISRTVTGRSG